MLAIVGLDWLVAKLRDLAYEVINAYLLFIKTLGQVAIDVFAQAVVAVVPAWDSGDIDGYLTTANYFVPLTESIGLGMIVFSVWALVFAYRLVKSWIPTVSGS